MSSWGWFTNPSFHSARVTRGAERAPRVVELNEIPTWPESFRKLQHEDEESDSDNSSVASRSSRSSRASARSSASKGGKAKSSSAKSTKASSVEASDEVKEANNESSMQDVEQQTAAAASSSSSDFDPSSAAAAAASSSFVAAATAAPAPIPLPESLPGNRKARFALYEQAFLPNAAFNRKVRLYRGDITKLRVDAVVNAANSGLYGGGGICGAIFDAAGEWKLGAACKRIRNETGSCPPGETRLTRGFGLPAPFILHTVGPMDGDHGDLINAYYSALDMCVKPVLLDQKATEHIQIRSLALCCISTGIYGFPNDDAAEVALRSTREWLDADPVCASAIDTIVFCVFLAKDLDLYESMLPIFFPVGKDEIEALALKEAADKEAAEVEEIKAEEIKSKQQNQKQSKKQHTSPAKSPRGGASAAAAASSASSKAASPSSAVAAARIPLPMSPPIDAGAIAAGEKASSPQSQASASSSAAAASSGAPTLSSPPPLQLKKRKSEEEADAPGKQPPKQQQPQQKQPTARPIQSQPGNQSAAPSHNAKSVAAAQARAQAQAALFRKPVTTSFPSHPPSRPSSSNPFSRDTVMAAQPEQESKQQPVHKPQQPQQPQQQRDVFPLDEEEEEEEVVDLTKPAAAASLSSPEVSHHAKKTKHQDY